MLDERQLATARWTLPLTGPPPSQTVLLIAVPTPLPDAARRRLAAEIGAVPGPRTIDWDSQVVWTSDEPDARIVSVASARGFTDTKWIKAIRERLGSIPAARFTGQTFPIGVPGS